MSRNPEEKVRMKIKEGTSKEEKFIKMTLLVSMKVLILRTQREDLSDESKNTSTNKMTSTMKSKRR